MAWTICRRLFSFTSPSRINSHAPAPRTALLIPQSAVQLDQAGSYVLTVDDKNKVEQRRITLGAERGSAVIVADGLTPGERVIVEGVQKVRPGQTVAPSPAPGN